MEPGEERDALIYLIADHMKKAMVAFNREQVDDKRVFIEGEKHGFRALGAPRFYEKRHIQAVEFHKYAGELAGVYVGVRNLG